MSGASGQSEHFTRWIEKKKKQPLLSKGKRKAGKKRTVYKRLDIVDVKQYWSQPASGTEMAPSVVHRACHLWKTLIHPTLSVGNINFTWFLGSI